MKKKAPKRNVGGKSADMQAARELELYIDNDGQLYRQQYVPIQVNLIKKKLAGTYDSKKAPKLFGYLMEAGAKKYAKEFGGTWHVMFDVPTRNAASKEYARNFEQQYRNAELDHLVGEAAPAAYKGMPGAQIRKLADKKGKLPKVKSKAAAAKALLANPGCKKRRSRANPLSSGYAYEFTGSGAWKGSPDDDWETVMQSGGKGRKVGYRFVDGVRVNVYKKGKKYFAQTALGSNPAPTSKRIASPQKRAPKKNPAKPGRMTALNKLTRV